MGIEVPDGTAPEQARPAQSPKKKTAIVAVSMIILMVGVVLIALVPDWGKDGDTAALEGQQTLGYFESNAGVFDVKIPIFTSDVTQGYATTEDLESDLEQLAKFVLNNAIDSYEKGRMPGGPVLEDVAFADSPVEGSPVESSPVDEGGDQFSDISDFDTNNQEENVDKADLAKSNGDLTFVAYQNHLLVWDSEGNVNITIEMPPIVTVDDPKTYVPEPKPEVESEPVESMTRDYPYYYNPKPYIQALLLEGDRLTVAVSGYQYAHALELDEPPILNDYLATHIRVYEINGFSLELVATKDVSGSFRSAYSVGDNAYIVTQTGMNTWDYLLSPIQRWQPQFDNLDDEEYREEAKRLAEVELIPNFVAKLAAELEDIDLARLSLYADSISNHTEYETALFGDNIADTITQVVSLDMSQSVDQEQEEELTLHIAGNIQPGSWGHVYATDSMIITADQGWSWVEERDASAQKTYLLGFSLDGASSSPAYVGSVPGYPLNPYALDFVEQQGEHYVRIATTQSFWQPWRGGFIADDVIIAMEPEEPEPESSTINQIIVMKLPEKRGKDEILEQVGAVTFGEPDELITAVRFFDEVAYAVTFLQTDPLYSIDLSDPEDPVVTGELKVPGFSQYLHPINDDNSVLIAIGQDADENGRVLGLKLSLFDVSKDLDNPEELDVYVFEQDQNTWSGSTASWDERAFRYFNVGGGEGGRLIIPVSIQSWGQTFESRDFEGFMVFSVIDNKIKLVYEIDHSAPSAYQYYYGCGWLPERSFVIRGDVMTLKRDSVVSTDLATGANEWRLNIEELDLCEDSW